jgi:hypothetical protein
MSQTSVEMVATKQSYQWAKGMFVSISQLSFLIEKMKSQKWEQTTNFSTDF